MSAVILRTNYVVDGFSTALQNMHIGDRWLVYIPYTLGYGTTDSGTIPAYSTLVFDITLLAYYHPGATIPTWQAKKNNVWIEE
jgi:FKBP-type peptidyl-prolyl cis-trans isomerase FklB